MLYACWVQEHLPICAPSWLRASALISWAGCCARWPMLRGDTRWASPWEWLPYGSGQRGHLIPAEMCPLSLQQWLFSGLPWVAAACRGVCAGGSWVRGRWPRCQITDGELRPGPGCRHSRPSSEGLGREPGLLFSGLGAPGHTKSLLAWCSGVNLRVAMGQKVRPCAHMHREVLKTLTDLA